MQVELSTYLSVDNECSRDMCQSHICFKRLSLSIPISLADNLFIFLPIYLF